MPDSVFEIYTPANLHRLPWPDTADGAYARAWLEPLMRHGTRAFFDNIEAEVLAVSNGEIVFPIILANALRQEMLHLPGLQDTLERNAYVCSPSSHYIDYALEEIEIELGDSPRWMRRSLEILIQRLGAVLQGLKFEKVVYVNNWLLSTNLYPAFQLGHLEAIRDLLVRRFPEHALMFRSVNVDLNQDIYSALRELNFIEMLSRQVYILDPSTGLHHKKKSYKRDLKVARKSEYRWLTHDEIQWHHIPRIRQLYDDLYLRKYSELNPQFNEYFIRESLERRWLNYAALERNGRIDAMSGYFERNGVITTPMVGYDTSLPQSLGLYRQLTLQLIQEAEAQNWIVNFSSGVSGYKAARGAHPALEYNLVYARHLQASRQAPWRLLQGLSRALMEPLMQHMQL